MSKHEHVLVLLGDNNSKGGVINPLPFEARAAMVAQFVNYNANVRVLRLMDMPDADDKWSEQVDSLIERSLVLCEQNEAILYGSRDSFIPHYHGKFPVEEIPAKEGDYSATQLRAAIKEFPNFSSAEFRAGIVWRAMNMYPAVVTTVDVAIFNEDETRVLLGRKPNAKRFRFIGGFSDPKSPNFEADARREVAEETGVQITDPRYIGSFRIDDPRYRREENKITTMFFRAKRMFGVEKAADDIEAIQWFDLDSLTKDDIVPEHEILLNALKYNKR